MSTEFASESTSHGLAMRHQCPCCRAVSTQIGVVNVFGEYRVSRCSGCGFVFAAPRPTPEQLADFYGSEYFALRSDDRLGYRNYRDLGELNARRMWHVFAGRLVPPDAGRRILDVGCATGGFLAEASAAGWQCTGVELSADAAQVGREQFGLNVIVGDIHSPDLHVGSFDVLTMWHVLEHLIDPVAALRRARDLLAAGGYLFIELPNWGSLGRIVKGLRWAQLKPPEHINFFTPKSLALACRSAGFTVEWATSAYPSVFDRLRLVRLRWPIDAAAAAVAAVACKTGHGGYVRLLARKS